MGYGKGALAGFAAAMMALTPVASTARTVDGPLAAAHARSATVVDREGSEKAGGSAVIFAYGAIILIVVAVAALAGGKGNVSN